MSGVRFEPEENIATRSQKLPIMYGKAFFGIHWIIRKPWVIKRMKAFNGNGFYSYVQLPGSKGMESLIYDFRWKWIKEDERGKPLSMGADF